MLQLAAPIALCLLPLPLLIWWFFPQTSDHSTTGLPVPFYNELQQYLKVTPSISKRSQVFYFFALNWLLLVLALAGPQWVGEPIYTTQQGRNIFMVLDISGSMALPDMVQNNEQVTRLQVVKEAAMRFVEERKTDHLGLILFGSEAYLQTPLTYDSQAILKRIIDASVGLAGKTTSIGDALGLAIKKLQSTPTSGRVIILLTDGKNNSGVLSPLVAAKLAKSENIKIYTIGLSTDNTNQRLMNVFIAMQGGADLDEDTLKEIAATTNGQYFRASDPVSLQKIYDTIDKLEAVKQTTRPYSPKRDFYPWLISLCIILLTSWLLRLGKIR